MRIVKGIGSREIRTALELGAENGFAFERATGLFGFYGRLLVNYRAACRENTEECR